MSTTIDQRVVSLQFDNKQFERNTATTMSTLDKLKEKLTFNKASKGLEDVGHAAKNVNLNGLGSGVEAVTAKFSAMQVIGITALANITNSAVNAGKRMVKALTIDPITTGFKEYETQINATQTIYMNTKSKGSSLDDVNEALDQLNKYADQTIYNFTEMTNNIGKFTAAGVDLQTSVDSIKGIANLAAVSGSTSQQASTAMYQLSQALAAGKVSLMDWNSVVNAGMGGQVFQDALVRTSELLGTGAKKAIKTYGSFRESLTKGKWLTTEVLTETLKQLSGAYTEADLIAQGYTKEQAKAITELANDAISAATEVKTFTQLWDVLKESAQSGWSQTWKLIIGDFNEAKKLLSPLADMLTGFINKMSDWRNRILQIALDFAAPWKAISDRIGKVSDVVSKVTGTLEYFQDVVDKVWHGDFNNWGDNPDRRDLLKKAGYDPKVVQYLVNLGEEAHKAGKTYKLTAEDVEKAHKKYGKTVELTAEETEAAVDSFNNLSDAKLIDADLTEEEIRLYRALEEEAKKHNTTVSKLAEEMSKADGRTMLIDSFKNVGKLLGEIAGVAKKAWVDIFNPPSAEVLGVRLYGAIRSLKEFTESLTIVDKETGKLTKNGENIKSIFEGLFAAIDIVITLTAGPLKFIFKMATQLCKVLGVSVLDVAGSLGKFIVKVRDGIDGVLDFTKVFEYIVPPIKNALSAFKDWIGKLKESENLPRDIAMGIANGLSKAWKAVKNFFKNLPENISNAFDGVSESPLGGFVDKLKSGCKVAVDAVVELGKMIKEKIMRYLTRAQFEEISADSIAGLIQGLKDKASNVWAAAVEMVSNLVQKVKDFLGIHSPSTVFIAIGGFIVAGLIGGIASALQNGEGGALQGFMNFFTPIIDWIKNIDLGQIFSVVMSTGILVTVKKLVDAVSAIASPFEGLGSVFDGVGKVLEKSARAVKKVVKSTSKVLDGFAKELKADAFKTRMEGFMTFVQALVLLIAAIVVLTFFKPADILKALGLVLAVGAVLVGLVWLMNKVNTASASVDWKKGIEVKGLTSGLLGLGLAILLIGMTVKMLGKLKPEQAEQGFSALIGIFIGLAGVIKALSLLNDGDVGKIGKNIFKMAAAIGIMALVAKMLGGLSLPVLLQGGLAVAAFGGIIVGLMAATKLVGDSGNVENMGKTILKISIAIGIMALVAKMLGELSLPVLLQGGLAVAAFGGIIVGLMAATKLVGDSGNVENMAKMFLGVGVAIGIMALAVKILGEMDPWDLLRGGIAIAAFAGIIVGLIAATKLAGGKAKIKNIGEAILGIAGAIAILALVAMLLSVISWTGFAKGVAMIGILTAFVVGLIAATRLAGGKNLKNVGSCLIAIAGAIGILALIAVILGFVPVEKLAVGVVAVGLLSLMMTALIKATKNVNKDSLWPLVTLAGIVALLGGILIALSCLDPKKVAVASLGLSALVGVMALLVFVTQYLAKANIDKAIWPLVTLAGIVALLGGILILMTALGVQDALPNAAALSILLVTVSAACAIVSVIPAAAAIKGALGLAAFVGIMAGVLLILGGLSKIPGFNELIADGGTTLALIGQALGAFVGSIVAGFAGAVLTILPMLGLALSGFMLGVIPFINGVKMVDSQVLTGAGILVAALLAFTVAELVSGIAAIGGIGLVALGTELSAFMIAALPFIATAAMITPEMMSGVKMLADTILILTAANVLEGLSSLFGGGSSLETFANQLPILGEGLSAFSSSLGSFTEEQLATVKCAADAVKTLASAAAEIPNTGGLLASIVGENDLGVFAAQFPILGSGLAAFLTNVGTFTEEQVATVNCAAQAIKTLAQASSEIPNSGGWLGQIVGENDLGVFAAQFPVLGTGLRGFLDNVGTFTEEQVATVDCAAQAIKTLASASSEIPNSGGWLGQIVGDNDLAKFAEQFPSLGSGLADFLTNVGTFTDDQVTTVDCAAGAIKALASAASEIPNTGGLLASIVGDNDLGDFASKFPKVGEGIKGFVDKLGSFSDAQLNTVSAGVSAIHALSSLANADLDAAEDDIVDFAEELPEFADNLKEFCSSMPSTESTTAAISNINKILTAVKDIGNANTGVLSTFADNLKKVGDDAVDKFVGAFTSNTAKTDLKAAAKSLAAQAPDGADDKKSAMESAGKDLGSGLVTGIDAKQNSVYWAGYRLGQKAVQGEKDGQKSNSPSKLTIQAGKWIGQGLIIGIDKMGRSVYRSGYSLGESAVKSTSSAISRIADAINTDIDAQPTIRPIMDLSDVHAGASAISSLLDTNSSIGVVANAGRIGGMMNHYSQNRGNDELVSEITKLRRDFNNADRSTYNINGITYDDGSNISDAVQTLIRAARVERRR